MIEFLFLLALWHAWLTVPDGRIVTPVPPPAVVQAAEAP